LFSSRNPVHFNNLHTLRFFGSSSPKLQLHKNDKAKSNDYLTGEVQKIYRYSSHLLNNHA